MTKIDFKIIAYKSKAWEEAVALREKILRRPLGQKFTIKELAEEREHHQVVGMKGDKIIATAVLVPEKNRLKMQRVVVDEVYRNSNIGSELMQFCEAFASANDIHNIYCHARDTAVNFYLKNQYSPVGDYFDEDGIPHLKMEKIL